MPSSVSCSLEQLQSLGTCTPIWEIDEKLYVNFHFVISTNMIIIENIQAVCRTTFFLNTIFVSSHLYPENPEGTQVIVGSMNTGYISDTARNQTHNLFRPKREPIPLGHSDGHLK